MLLRTRNKRSVDRGWWTVQAAAVQAALALGARLPCTVYGERGELVAWVRGQPLCTVEYRGAGPYRLSEWVHRVRLQ